MSFNLDEYVDVAERIREFAAKYPEGSLQSEIQFVDGGVLCQAFAYRSPEDAKPGIGHAFEPIPGKTPYTRDSEVMNAETSAWGRAIVALGFNTKKIASRQEVANRSAGEPSATPSAAAQVSTPQRAVPSPADSPFQVPEAAKKKLEERTPPDDEGNPARVLITFGKHNGKRISEVPQSYVHWLASEKFEPKTAEQRRIRLAAAAFLAGNLPMPIAEKAAAADIDDIPF